MARLLENQAAQVLREANTLSTGGGNLASSGDIRGFTNIAFPIVRRVFGGLVANDLVSIQPMSLPSGLLFYLDYTYGNDVGGDASSNLSSDASHASTYGKGNSIYAQPTGKGVQSGSLATGGQYDLVGTTYSKVHANDTSGLTVLYTGSFTNGRAQYIAATGTDGKHIQFDAQLSKLIEEDVTAASTGQWQFLVFDLDTIGDSNMDTTQAKDITIYSASPSAISLKALDDEFQGGAGNILNLRRLNQIGTWDAGTSTFTASPLIPYAHANGALLTVVSEL